MSRGVASAAARRSPAPRPRPETTARPPARRPPAPAAADAARERPPTARERMKASFGAVGPEPESAAAPGLASTPTVAQALTTRERIVNRALGAPTPAPRPAEPVPGPAGGAVVDLAAFRASRPQREPESRPVQPTARGPPAPVVELAPKSEVAEPQDEEAQRGETAARAAPGAAGPAVAAAPTAAEPPAGAAAPSADRAAEPGAPQKSAAPQPAAAAEAAVAPAAPAVIRNPEDEPGFQAMKARTERAAVRTKRHQTGGEAAAIAQGASEPDPQQDVASQAAAERVGTMAGAKPGEFDPADFKAKVKAAILGMAPPATLEEADEFEESGRAAGAATAMEQLVLAGRDTSQSEIKGETTTPPDPEGKDPKTVGEMVNDRAGPPLPGVGAAEALPGPRPAEQIDLSSGPLEIDAKLVEANVTEEQLAQANEPEFSGALDARREARERAEADPAAYRLQEEQVLAAARAGAEGAAVAQLEGMHGARVDTLGAVRAAKGETKSADQLQHEQVHAALLDIHTRTQEDVTTILETLDTTVETIFTSGEQAARDRFEASVDQRMRAYKADRYGGLGGGVLWAKDKLFDLPDEVNVFYVDGRANYLADMDGVIDLIAGLVGLMLGAAKLRIEAGRIEVETYVAGLDESLRTLGTETAADLDNRFDQLDSDVDSKRDELVDTVARKYVESRDGLDERIKELQEANKGLVSKAIDAIVGVLKTIYELGKLLLRVILKAAAAIGDIIAHPIRFLENLVGAIKGGLERFVSRLDVHLQNSLVDLLFGELGKGGITMPKQLDFAGILDLVLQVIGLTYDGIRERLVNRFGEETVAGMEAKVDIFKTLVKDGIAGVWTWIREKLSDLEDLVVGKIKAYIVERVVGAGISYIVALLNPAAAFIKACQGIYQIVMFIVERAKQIAAFVEAVLDSIAAIAQGNVGTAIEKVESALAGGLSLAIAFLARLANLGALSEKVRSIIALVRKPITRIVDQVVFGAAQLYRRTVGPAVAFGKAKVAAGREWAKGKVEAGKAWVDRKAEAAKARLTGRDVAPEAAEEPEAKPPAEEQLAQPMRLAEEQIEVAPGEQHTVFAQLAATGQVDVGVSSTPQLVTGLADHFEPRIDTLPVTPPNPLPEGGQPADRPRSNARTAADGLRRGSGKLEAAFEQDYAQHEARLAAGGSRRIVAPYAPPARLTSRLDDLVGKHVRMLLRMFYAYDNPRFARTEDEPERGQKLTGRVWAVPDARGGVLPEGPALGVRPTLARVPGSHVLEEAPHLTAPTRGPVREPGAEPARGIVVEPAAGRPEVVVRSWAIGGRLHGGSNASHTETQFYHWLVAQGEEFHGRITAIELRSVLSPCGDCTTLLTGISRLVRKRAPGVRPASLVVFWDRVYGSEEGDVGPAAATFRRHVVYLADAGWIAHGPKPSV